MDELAAAAATVLDRCRARHWTVATAESCTGGLVAGALTDVAGSSDVVDCGFVTYSNAAKQRMLGVRVETLAEFGAVSSQTATEMARGALAHSGADLSVAITGIAGPGGGSDGKPVGLVYFAATTRSGRLMEVERRFGDIGRARVRRASVLQALNLLAELAGDHAGAGRP